LSIGREFPAAHFFTSALPSTSTVFLTLNLWALYIQGTTDLNNTKACWKFRFEQPVDNVSSPLVADDGRVFIYSSEQRLFYGFDPDHAILWKISIDQVASQPAYDPINDVIIFATFGGLNVLDAKTGKLTASRSQKFSGEVSALNTVAAVNNSGFVSVFFSTNTSFYVFSLASKTFLHLSWVWDFNPIIESSWPLNPVASAKRATVMFITKTHQISHVYNFCIKTGKLKWNLHGEAPSRASDNDSDKLILYENDRKSSGILLTNGQAIKFDVTTGAIIFSVNAARFGLGTPSGLAADANFYYISHSYIATPSVTKIHASSGLKIWNRQLTLSEMALPGGISVDAGGNIFLPAIGDKRVNLFTFDSNGQLLGTSSIGDQPVRFTQFGTDTRYNMIPLGSSAAKPALLVFGYTEVSLYCAL
jgi:outer membrane protein assembly factor BamB